MEYTFRKATTADLDGIMTIIEEAKQQMKREGKHQWDQGYPARTHIEHDISTGVGYVMLQAEQLMAYGAVVLTGEPAYDVIQGHWLSDEPFVVLHRLAVAEAAKGHGIGLRFIEKVEQLALSVDVHSFRVDTNYDNERMLRLLDKAAFTYCGNIIYQQGSRMAFEKMI